MNMLYWYWPRLLVCFLKKKKTEIWQRTDMLPFVSTFYYITISLFPTQNKRKCADHAHAEASLQYFLQLWWRGCGQVSLWVWFWRWKPSTTLENSWRRSPGRANKLAIENQHSQKRHLYDFRESFPPHFSPDQEHRA